jgi:hypothetical protein
VILVHCRPLPETRTRNSSAAWLAECEVDGRRFEAKSRHGAPNELARRLVEAGVPDAPIEIHYDGLAGSMRYRSFHEAARWTFVESQSTPLRRGPFREFGEASKGAGTVLPGDRGCVTSATAGSSWEVGPATALFPTVRPGGQNRPQTQAEQGRDALHVAESSDRTGPGPSSVPPDAGSRLTDAGNWWMATPAPNRGLGTKITGSLPQLLMWGLPPILPSQRPRRPEQGEPQPFERTPLRHPPT